MLLLMTPPSAPRTPPHRRRWGGLRRVPARESISHQTITKQIGGRLMDVGMMMVFASYGWENCSDDRVWNEEIRLARLAADLGFDCLWSAEHHFNDYSFVPDNLALMTHLTALCPNI